MYCEDKVPKSWLRTEEKVNVNSDDFDKVCKRKQGLLVESENTTRWNIGTCWLWSHFFLNIKYEMLNIKHPTDNDKYHLNMQNET